MLPRLKAKGANPPPPPFTSPSLNQYQGQDADPSIATAPAGPNESGIRRAAFHKDSLAIEPYPGVNTVADILDYAARTHGDRPAFGWRDVLDIIEEEKEVIKTIGGEEIKQMKTWKYFK